MLQSDEIRIVSATKRDLNYILFLFSEVMELQRQKGHIIWDNIDTASLEKDINDQCQFKVLCKNEFWGIFTVKYNDPCVWHQREQNDALYLHRIVANPNFMGRGLFQKILDWAKTDAKERGLKFIRMDTWSSNTKLINYYKLFGFEFMENYKTGNEAELPIQNRNLEVALLELKLR